MGKPRVVAYCMESVVRTTHRATGAWPITCPPFTADTFNVGVFKYADVIWLGLHGVETNPDYLYGDEVPLAGMNIPMRMRALNVASLLYVNLSGKVVFATSCHLDKTAFPDMLKSRGAIVIGGPGKNYGDTEKLVGADKLGAAFVKALHRASSIVAALDEAKRALGRSRADTDALEFGLL